MQKSNSKTAYKKLIGGITIVIALIVAYVFTSFAWTSLNVSVMGNAFTTGDVKVELVIDGDKLIDNEHFEPGARLKGDFSIKNTGDVDSYVKVYLVDETVADSMADIIEVSIFDISDTEKPVLLKEGKASEIIKDNMEYFDTELKPNEEMPLRVIFHLPETVGNEVQGKSFDFTLSCDAVQARNYTKQ